MRYEIKGDTLPVVVCYLEGGEQMITERGSMSWMSPNMKMETTTNGGIGKAFGRMFSGEAMFQNRYTAMGGEWNDCVCIQFSGTDSCPSDRSRTGTDCSEDRIPCIGGRGQSFGLFSEKVRSRDFRWRRIYYAETVRKWNGFSGI